MQTREQHERFESRITGHRKIIYKICNAYCPDRDDREDLAQEILVQLWRSFGTFDDVRSSFSTWMYRVALNTALAFARREFRRRRHVVAVEDRVLATIPALEPEDTGPQEVLSRLIAPFSPLNKALLLLYLDGNSYQEIADVLGISTTNVATKITRLKDAMKNQADMARKEDPL